MKDILRKWLALVTVNSILSFYFGLVIMENNNPWAYIGGMITGIVIFAVLYTRAEIRAREENNILFIDTLTISVIIKAALQLLILFTPFITLELWIGVMAVEVTNLNNYISVDTQSPLFGGSIYQFCATFFLSLVATLVTGSGLSLAVVVISAPVSAYVAYKDNKPSA